MISNTMAGANQPQQPAQPAAPAAAAGAASVMTLEEAAAYLKVSPADVEAIITSGELKARKIGTQYRISKEAIDAYLAG
jgi:excisionase family DNA binding protein